jgi:hypothetical protein
MFQQTYKCDSKAFQGIVNPYTDEPVETFMRVRSGRPPEFFAPKTYSPVSPHEPGTAPAMCFWTGKVLKHVTDEAGKVWAMGGFNPHVPTSRENYLYFMHMRNGVSSLPPPSEARVEPVREEAPMPLGHETPVREEAVKAAEDILKKSGFQTQKETAVTVPRKVGKK